jgi:uncharacterized protein involved in high-affinity Fe2+ transport
MSESKIPVIRKDALVQLSMATGFIQRLQQLSVFMISEKSESEIENFIKLLNEGKTDFDEPWMNNYLTMVLLLRAIDDAALKQGFVDNLTEDQAASLLDSLPLDQSPEQPE